jgi:signal transduction histidine kinase
VRFAPSGTPVRVTVGGSGDRVRISVLDQGRPATEEELATAFEPRMGGGAEGRRGSGPGLLITRLVVQGHAGAVGLAPAGLGAELWMDLPLLSGVVPGRAPE